MQGRTSVEVLDVILAVQLELVHYAEALVLRIVEVRAVHVVPWRDEVTVLGVPLVVLSGKVLAGNKLGVEHCILGAVLTVALVDGLEQIVHELLVLVVGRYLQSEELGGIGQTVHADGEILTLHVDETGTVDI